MTTKQGFAHRSTSAVRAGTPVRVLVVLALLVGLFGMHGLGADHSVAAPGAHGSVLAGPASPAGHSTSARHAAPAPDAHVAVLPPLGHAAPPSHHGPADGHPTGAAQACVAVLAGAALLALLLPDVLRALAPLRPAVHRSVLRTRIPPLPALRPPDLSVLCVLRT